jgi:hypothetical protein
LIGGSQEQRNWLTKGVCLVEHLEGHSPSNIAVQRNLQGFKKPAAKLDVPKIFNLLSGCLNLSNDGSN